LVDRHLVRRRRVEGCVIGSARIAEANQVGDWLVEREVGAVSVSVSGWESMEWG
jgi:hypothetical protein